MAYSSIHFGSSYHDSIGFNCCCDYMEIKGKTRWQKEGEDIMSLFNIIKNNNINELEQYLRNHDTNEEIQGQSLLYWTAHQGNVEFAKLLIEKGANVNQKDEHERSILSVAAFFGHTDIARLLLQHNAIIDSTAMDRAYKGWDGYIQTDILALFSEYGWINLYVDDLRSTPPGFKIARTVEESINLIEKNQVHILSLDHDLGMDDKGNLLPTGYDLVKYICEKGLRMNRVYIHSDNPVGRENMFQTLLSSRKRGFISADIEIYHYAITKNTYTDELKGSLQN